MMNQDSTDMFESVVAKTFSTMLGCTIEKRSGGPSHDQRKYHDISGVIGITGDTTGTIVLSLESNVAISAAEALLGERPDGMDSEVVDAIGELTNIIGGSAKSKFASKLDLALPTVIVGRDYFVTFDRGVTPIRIIFKCEWGRFLLDFGFAPAKQNAATRPAAVAQTV